MEERDAGDVSFASNVAGAPLEVVLGQYQNSLAAYEQTHRQMNTLVSKLQKKVGRNTNGWWSGKRISITLFHFLLCTFACVNPNEIDGASNHSVAANAPFQGYQEILILPSLAWNQIYKLHHLFMLPFRRNISYLPLSHTISNEKIVGFLLSHTKSCEMMDHLTLFFSSKKPISHLLASFFRSISHKWSFLRTVQTTTTIIRT